MIKNKIKSKLYFFTENYKDWYKEDIKTKDPFQQNPMNRSCQTTTYFGPKEIVVIEPPTVKRKRNDDSMAELLKIIMNETSSKSKKE